ncbi:MAG: tetratricopeptide repeat protein [Hyphomonadaceae bacterium]|nr:tetratricopeptide repeat protein [Hyphomonadaceae bacterium]
MKVRESSALAIAARELLNNGDAIGAERVLSPIFNELRTEDVSVTHLMGLIMKAQGKMEQAERYLRSAVAHSLKDGTYYNDLAVVLQQRAKYDEAARIFRAAIALMPGVEVVRSNLVRCLMVAGKVQEAEREARNFVSAMPCAEAWNMLATVQRAQERREEALASAEKALSYAPKDRILRQNYAVGLDRVGRLDDAIARYEELAQESMESPELTLNFARALYARRRKQDAETVLTEAVKHWPTSAALHASLARMRALRGEGEACTAILEGVIAQRPRDHALYLLCADSLHRAGFTAKAERIVQEGLRRLPDAPALLTALGILQDELDRPAEGLKYLRRSLALTGGAAVSQRNMLSTLLRAGEPDEALRMTRALRKADPNEQYLIATEATALRMLGDPAYNVLYDYGRFVRAYEIAPPRGFFNSENFNASLADCLRAMHRTWAHPLDQVINDGSVTNRSLLTVEEPNLKAWFGAIDEAIGAYIGALSAEEDHPFTRRRRDHFRFSGCWSLRLTKGGVQAPHVHDAGWISSAYYAALPNGAKGRDGWLKFGEPSRPIKGCGVDHVVEPKVGMLVLFPSYIWHGTYPFGAAAGERLSLAFDLIPA